ncbi:VanZ family protein [Catenibacillus scindens]|uniref:VanZ family protein n=1 Tax=Catenibacillus scindens TaxID=673271 RepID=UPI0032091DA9
MGDYPAVIMQAVILFPFAAFLFTLPYILYNYHKYGSVLSIRIGIVYSFILYLMCVFFLVILPLPSRAEVLAMTGPRAQPIPFKFVADIIRQAHIDLSDPGTYTSIFNKALFQFLFNVIMTMPFGIYLRYYFQCSFKKTALLSFGLSLLFELTQLSGLYFIYPRSYRLFDVDDLIANTAGGMLGYAASFPFIKILPSRNQIDQISFHRGREVSFSRRLISFMCDIPVLGLLSGIIAGICHVLHWDIPYPPVLAAFIYYAFVPMTFRGKTFGKYVTRTRIIPYRKKRASWYQYLLRPGIFLIIMVVLPRLIFGVFIPWLDSRGVPAAGTALLSLTVAGVYFFYIFFAAIMAALHHRLFYEKLSGTCIVSTIKIE